MKTKFCVSRPGCRNKGPASARKSTTGFSLIELLAVVGVMAVMASYVVPAFNAISSSRNVQKGIYEVSGLLEFARNEAMTRQTYVWVGFQNTTAGGSPELRMAAMFSRDGSVNPAASNLASLSPVLRISHVALSEWQDLKGATRGLFTNAVPVSVAGNPASMSFSVGPNTFGQTLTFTPRGEVLLEAQPGPDSPYDACIDVSFRRVQGGQALASADDAAVLVDGGTGAIRRVRLP